MPLGKQLTVLGLILGACAHSKGVDPLAERRMQLAMAENSEAPVAAESPLEISVSQKTLSALTESVVRIQSKNLETVYLSGPMGMPIESKNTVESAEFGAGAGQCEGCLGLDLTLKGNSLIGGGMSSIRAPMTWTVGIDGELSLGVARRDVMLTAERDWRSSVSVGGLPPLMQGTAQAAMKGMMDGEIAKMGLNESQRLFSLPDNFPLELTNIALDADEGLSASVSFALLSQGQLEAMPAPESGWRVRVPAKTLFGLADAYLLKQPVSNGYSSQVMGLEVDEGLALRVRLWRANKKMAYREFQLPLQLTKTEKGTYELVMGTLAWGPGMKGWATPGMRLVGRKALEKNLRNRLKLSVNARHGFAAGGMLFQLTIDSVDASSQTVEISGSMTVRELPEASKENSPQGSSPQP